MSKHMTVLRHQQEQCWLRVNTLRPRQNCRRYIQMHFIAWKFLISIKISPKSVPSSPIDNKPTLVQIMDIFHWTDDVYSRWRSPRWADDTILKMAGHSDLPKYRDISSFKRYALPQFLDSWQDLFTSNDPVRAIQFSRVIERVGTLDLQRLKRPRSQ